MAAPHALVETCYRGDRATLRRLVAGGLTAAEVRAENCRVLCLASMKGHADVVGDLADAFGLTADDARASNGLRWACQYGHTAVVRRLLGMGLTAADARDNRNLALSYASAMGNLEVVEMLVGTGLTPADALQPSVGMQEFGDEQLFCAFHLACYKGHAEVVEFLLGTGLTAADARAAAAHAGAHAAVAAALEAHATRGSRTKVAVSRPVGRPAGRPD